MRDGEYIGTVKLSETTEDQLTKMMVGRTVSFEKIANEAVDMNQVVLKVEKLRYKEFLKDISFELHKGEILGFAGLVGAGRTEVAKCMIGAYRKDGGTVTYKGETLSNSLSRNIEKGIVYLSEDRKDEGLVLMHSVMDNIALPNLKQLAKPFIRKRRWRIAQRITSKACGLKPIHILRKPRTCPEETSRRWLLQSGCIPMRMYIYLTNPQGELM